MASSESSLAVAELVDDEIKVGGVGAVATSVELSLAESRTCRRLDRGQRSWGMGRS